MIRIGLLGCGTVGSGVVKLLEKNAATIAQRSGDEIVVYRVLERDRDKCLAVGIAPEQIANSIEDIVNDPEIDIVVELIGGIEPARSYILQAMRQGKHVVTANKDLIAVSGKELFETAEENQVDFYFEASVGGGIPIVFPLKQSLAGNRIQQVIGILNGTTNYILTQMSRSGRDFNEALAEAQALAMLKLTPLRMSPAWTQPVRLPFSLP